MKTSRYKKKNKFKIEYPRLPLAIHPVPLQAETLVPIFQLFSLEDLDHNEGFSDSSNHADFENEGELINVS